MEAKEKLKSNELKSGNLIIGFYETEEDNDLHETICEFKFYDCYNNFYWVESKNKITDFSGFKPIPLTEEWLLKFGFDEKLTKGWFFNDIFLLEKHIFKNIFYIRFRINEQESIEISKIKYVHQLQNLFFFLTGQELTLNN